MLLTPLFVLQEPYDIVAETGRWIRGWNYIAVCYGFELYCSLLRLLKRSCSNLVMRRFNPVKIFVVLLIFFPLTAVVHFLHSPWCSEIFHSPSSPATVPQISCLELRCCHYFLYYYVCARIRLFNTDISFKFATASLPSPCSPKKCLTKSIPIVW